MRIRKKAALSGLAAPLVFACALVTFGYLNADFDFFNDFVSELGATGAPNALGWNLLGFATVGVLLTVFGLAYGKVIQDRPTGVLLAFFGFGFGLTALPTNLETTDTPLAKAHVIAICLALACWLLGLARMSANQRLDPRIRVRAKVAAILIVIPIIGFTLGFWSMPLTHRLVFLVVFGWTSLTAAGLLRGNHDDRRPLRN